MPPEETPSPTGSLPAEMAIRQEVDTLPPIEVFANPVEEPVKPSATSRMRRRSSPAPETPSPRLEREPQRSKPDPRPKPQPRPEPSGEPEVQPVWAEPEQSPEPSWMMPAEALASEPEPAWIAPEPRPPVNDLRRRYEALGDAVRTNGELRPPDDENPVADEPETRPRRARQRRDDDPTDRSRKGRKQAEKARLDEHTPVEDAKPVELSRAEARMEGHHPIESSTGPLGRLRRPPKLAEDHVHVTAESRSAVGLTRRVCIECSHVSISADE